MVEVDPMQKEGFNRQEALVKTCKAAAMIWWIPLVIFLSWPIEWSWLGYPLRVWLLMAAPFVLVISGCFAIKVLLSGK